MPPKDSTSWGHFFDQQFHASLAISDDQWNDWRISSMERSFPLLKYLYRVYSDPKLVVRIFFQAFGNNNIYHVA